MRANHKNSAKSPSRRHKNSDFDRLLTHSGLTQAELSERVGAHRNTVTGWARGRSRVPGAVAAYLRLVGDVRALVGG